MASRISLTRSLHPILKRTPHRLPFTTPKLFRKSHPCPLWSSSFSFCLSLHKSTITPTTSISPPLSFSCSSSMATAAAVDDNLQSNPLLQEFEFPPFDSVQADHVRPGIRALLKKLEDDLVELERTVEPSWPKLVEPLEKIVDRLSVVWGIVNHLKSVKDSSELRSAIEEVQPEKVKFQLRLGQSKPLYNAFKAIQESPDWHTLSDARKRIVESQIKEAVLNGVSLEDDKRENFNKIQQELERLSQKFEENVLDATKKFEKLITDEKEIEGLPATALGMAAQTAVSKGHENATAENGPWIITLDGPSFLSVMQHARNRSLREEIYRAYITRASSGDLDNTAIINEILKLRLEKAKLLNYNNYAEVSMATKMATVESAQELLEKLRSASWDAAVQDNSGSHVRITERSRLFSVTMLLDLEAAYWLLVNARAAITQGKQGVFRRIFRGRNCKIVMDTGSNRAGNFLKILKVEQGSLKNIIIPGEAQEQGWKDFIECLHNIFSRKVGSAGRSKQPPPLSGGVHKGFISSKGEEMKKGFQENRTWRDVVLESQSTNDATGFAPEKTHKLAVIIYRFNLRSGWGKISTALGAILHRRAEVVPLAADRAITWCTEEREKAFLLKERWINDRNHTIAKMENWQPEVHWNYTQIAVNHSWIGLEGIPLNLWNYHVFKIIGDCCGGLIEIAEETRNKSFLRFAKLKVKGSANGFMHPILEFPCEGRIIHAGIFSLGEYRFQSEVVYGGLAGLLRRSREKEDEGDVGPPHPRLVPHQMSPHPGWVGETAAGELFQKGVEEAAAGELFQKGVEDEKSASEEEKSASEEAKSASKDVITDLCESQKTAAISNPAEKGAIIEGQEEDREPTSSDLFHGPTGPPYIDSIIAQKDPGPDLLLIGLVLNSNSRPNNFKAKQRNQFSSGCICSKGPSNIVKEKQILKLGSSPDKAKKDKPSLLYVYSRKNRSKSSSVWDNRADAASELQEGEQGLNDRCQDRFDGEDNIQDSFSSEDEEDSSEESDEYFVPETDDEANSWGDSDEILEALPGLFEKNQNIVISTNQDQVCNSLENFNQVGDFLSRGQQEVSRFYGGRSIPRGLDVLSNCFLCPFFSDINWLAFYNSHIFHLLFVTQSFLGLERIRYSNPVLRIGPASLQSSDDSEVVGQYRGAIGCSGITGESHRSKLLSEEEWKTMKGIVGNISFSQQSRVISEKDPKKKPTRISRELRRLQSTVNYERSQSRVCGGKILFNEDSVMEC